MKTEFKLDQARIKEIKEADAPVKASMSRKRKNADRGSTKNEIDLVQNQRESTQISDEVTKLEQVVPKKRVKITESRSKSRPQAEKVRGVSNLAKDSLKKAKDDRVRKVK